MNNVIKVLKIIIGTVAAAILSLIAVLLGRHILRDSGTAGEVRDNISDAEGRAGDAEATNRRVEKLADDGSGVLEEIRKQKLSD